MKQITINNKIFTSKAFQKDKYRFSLINKMTKSPTFLCISDEENYLLARGAVDFPTWIWTKDNLSSSKVKEIETALNLFLTDSITKFTCKEELYKAFLADNLPLLNKDDYFEMGTLECHKLKPLKKDVGKVDYPTTSDLDVIATYWYDNSKEMTTWAKPLTKSEALLEAQKFIQDKNFYVLRNFDHIVSMASYSVVDDQAKMTHVYTPPLERKKGYALEAAVGLINWAFSNELLEEITASCFITNTNSIKLLKKLNFKELSRDSTFIHWLLLKETDQNDKQ